MGDMVRRRHGGRLMRILDVFNGMARCVSVDQHGVLRQHFYYTSDLMPLRIAIGARTTWPEIAQIDLREAEDVERAARANRKKRENAARKARRSNKIKRSNHAAA